MWQQCMQRENERRKDYGTIASFVRLPVLLVLKGKRNQANQRRKSMSVSKAPERYRPLHVVHPEDCAPTKVKKSHDVQHL